VEYTLRELGDGDALLNGEFRMLSRSRVRE